MLGLEPVEQMGKCVTGEATAATSCAFYRYCRTMVSVQKMLYSHA